MDVKNIFLNRYISKEVYAKQPPSFKSHNFKIMFLNLKEHFMVQKNHLELSIRY